MASVGDMIIQNNDLFDRLTNLINPYLLSMEIIASFESFRQHSPTSAAIFCLQQSVQYCTLSSERLSCNVKLACNKHSDITRLPSLDFTIYYFLTI